VLLTCKFNRGNRTTDFSYQGDGLFRENGQRVNQIGVVQNIPNPASVKAQNAFQNEQVKRQFLQKELTEKELTLQVKQTYLELQQYRPMSSIFKWQLLGWKRVKPIPLKS